MRWSRNALVVFIRKLLQSVELGKCLDEVKK